MAEEAAVVVRVEASPRDGELVQRVEARGHRFLVDEPLDVGDDLAATPYEFLLAGLGACTSMTLQMYARHKGIALEQVSVRLTYNRDYVQDCQGAESDEPAPKRRVHRIEREISLVGDLSDDDRGRLLDIAERCPVHRTMVEEKEIVSRLV
jgi:putative redox protein